MNLFRLQNNVPSVYVEESRDFQLFCRLYDCIFNNVIYDTKTILSILDPKYINDRLLRLYATKVGFFTDKNIDNTVYRYILSAFPTALKNKGTKLGIEQAVAAILKAENSNELPIVEIIKAQNNSDGVYDDDNSYYINILTPIEIYNKVALEEFLKYIIPAGFRYTIRPYTRNTADLPILLNSSLNGILKVADSVSSTIKESQEEEVLNNNPQADRQLGSYYMTTVKDENI